MIEPFNSLALIFGGAILFIAMFGAVVVAFEALMERLTRPKQ